MIGNRLEVKAMRKHKFILLIFCFVICLTACQPIGSETQQEPLAQNKVHSNFKKGYSQYTNGIFGFYLTFPAAWASSTSEYREATDQYNSSPDSEIRIFIDGDEGNYICVYGQHGQIAVLDSDAYEATEFHTDSGLSGVLYQREIDARAECHLVFSENKHLAASIRMDLDVFQKNEEKIIGVLKSIEQIL